MKKKLIRVSTVPESLETFCKGQLKWLSQYYDVVAISSPLQELDIIQEREGVKTIAVSMERHISLWKDLKSLVRMIIVLHQEKPDIVHSMTPKAGLITMLAAWICRVPVRMHTYTGLVFPTATGVMQQVLIWTDRILCACANCINPEGKGVANDLKKFNITSKPLHIIGNGNVRGVDLTYWSKKSIKEESVMPSSLGIENDDFVFIFVGRLVGDKGINELIEAFEQIHQPHVKLLLVGPYEQNLDPLKEITMETIASDKRIITTGSQRDVRPYYALADAFVFPSYREGFPNTVLEAGAMELPSIVTNINGANEIIEEGLNGIIIPARNSVKLLDAMNVFLENKAMLKQMANNARKVVETKFEQKFLWKELLKTYQSFS